MHYIIRNPEEHQALKDQEFVRVMIERQQNEEFDEWQRLSRKPAKVLIDLESIEQLEEEYDIE